MENWWKHAIEGEEDIDQKSIDNTQHIHEMDEDAQSDYRRVMYDFEQKRQGKPSSKELVSVIELFPIFQSVMVEIKDVVNTH